MKMGLVQLSPEWENPEKSIEKVEALLDKVNLNELELLIFPELTLTGFTMNAEKFAEEIDGISMKMFIELASSNKINIFGGLIEKYENKFYNTLIHFDENGLIKARYRKIHPFSLGKEDKYYSQGKEVVVTKINDFHFGLSICYDLRFPELYRLLTLNGAEILVNIANWPIPRINHWKLLTQANAIQQLSYFIGVNRTLNDPYNEYNGCSRIISPMGEVIIEAENAEEVIIAEINPDEVKNVRENFPFLNDIKLIKKEN